MWSLLIPSRCPVCQTAGPAPCRACWALLREAPSLPPPPGLDRCLALLRYEGAGRQLLARLKYRNARSALGWLGGGMAALADAQTLAFDVVTWAPTTTARRRRRGYDQAELLARAVAGRLGLPTRALLRRLPGPAQTGRSRADRHDGPRLRPIHPPPPNVLLVDDVRTTGATLSAAATALRSAGAEVVVGLTAGATALVHPGIAAGGDGRE